MGVTAKQAMSCVADSLQKILRGKAVRYGTPSLDLCVDPTLASILGETPHWAYPLLPLQCDTYVGWGRRSGELAARLARWRKAGLLRLEDGFIRSFERTDPSLSLVVDDVGIYYDATKPSRLEQLIAQPIGQAEVERARTIRASWVNNNLSKYNAGQDFAGPIPDRYVLVVDQVLNDASVKFGLGDLKAFEKMLDFAITENPGLDVLVKMHPDIYTKSKSGHFDADKLLQRKNIVLVAENCLPGRLIRRAEKVYTVTSQMGFEALIWGKPVRCFGMPFYAGWGVTEDELKAPDRRVSATLDQLIYAALLAYPVYFDHRCGSVCDVETVIEIITKRKLAEETAKDLTGAAKVGC